ncbi:YciI family protein [Gryllotalpicola koreensis]|uniref:YciI family protein n=1 Tax=Gryllotalpicola koreensis TaxID=993086 RepID=A0ABP8A8P0_9MICO
MAEFLILIYGDDEKWGQRTEAQLEQLDAAHRAFQAGGALASGELDAPEMAKTIRGALVTDGPFAEFKEVLGGFYVIEAADVDEAVARASGLYETHEPHARIEVHPLIQH